MQSTKFASRSDLIRESKKRYGKNTVVVYDPAAPNAAELERRKEANAIGSARLKEIGARLATISKLTHFRELATAARFVVDVAGDSPSIEQLAAALAVTEEYFALRDEQSTLQEEAKRRVTWRRRYTVMQRGTLCGISTSTVLADGDTIEEVLRQVLGDKTK